MASRHIRKRLQSLQIAVPSGWGWKRYKGCGLYCASVARSLMPVYAAAIILLGVLTQPYLNRVERALLEQDPILTVDSERGAFTRMESDLVERLKAEMLHALPEEQR